MSSRVVVLGVPSAAGAFTDSPSRSTQAIRDAGLVAALTSRGLEVEDGGDIGPFHSAEDSDHPTCRNVAGVVDMMKRTESAVADAGKGLTLAIGGDCSFVSGVLAGARKRAGGPVALVYLDAHGDLNTPQTTPSGRICGMALAVALGHGQKDLVSASGHTPLVDPARTALLGLREIDPGERKLMENVGLALEATDVIRSGPEAAADLALRVAGDLPIVVHFDVDIIDGREMATHLPAALGRGLPRTDVALLLRKLLKSPRVVALSVSGFDMDSDADGSHARALVEILAGGLQKPN
jgi:arginase